MAEKYRVLHKYGNTVAWSSPKLSKPKAEALLAKMQEDDRVMFERQLHDDPRGEQSPVVKRARLWTYELVGA